MGEGTTKAVAVAAAAGLCGAIQPKINSVLGARVGSALLASLVNFSGALVMVVAALCVRPGTRRKLRRIATWQVPRWTLTAGLGGAVIVMAGAFTVQTIGVAIFSVAFFAGQIIFGLVVDRLGVAPGGRRSLTPARLQAVVLAVAAVLLSQAGAPSGEFAPGLVVFVIAAGAAFAFQSSFNGRITVATGDPVAATTINVTVGTVVLATTIGVLAAAGALDRPHWPSEPWLYAGGALGVTVVVSLAIATAALGALRATLTMLAAQMTAAIFVDWVIVGKPPRIGVIAGAVIIVTAVAIVGRRSPTVMPVSDR